MILAFKFNYISKNALLENMLESVCKDFNIYYKIGKIDNIVNLYVEGNESELTSFSDFIGERLPLSIFFKSIAVNVVDIIPDNLKSIEECSLCLPFTPKTFSTCKQNNFDPLINNEVGISTFDAKGVLLKKSASIIEVDNFNNLYQKVVEIIKSGEEVHIDSTSGSYTIGKIENIKEDDFIVIPTDLSVVEKMVVIKENEIKALASLEKPAIKLRVNSLYSSKEILPTKIVKVKLPDELLLFNICNKLNKDGIDFIYRVDKTKPTCKYTLNIDGTFNRLPQIEVCVLENGEILIVNGDGYSPLLLKENLKKFDCNGHAQFASIMQEHNLFDEKVSCFYMSKTHDDMIMHHSQTTGMLDLVKFPVINDIKEVFEIIKQSDIGKKLIENYIQQFPDIYEKAIECKISQNVPNNIYTIWGIAAVILGFSDNIEEGSEKVIEFAEDFSGKKGPRVDYLLIDKESIKSDFDMIRLIRSSISFKLAGTDDIILSFGMMEALSYFLSDTSDSCNENLSSEKILLCGAMFSIKKFTEITCKNITVNSYICFNRELPIDN